MKQIPRAYNKLFADICKQYGLKQLKADECVIVKTVNNTDNSSCNLDLNGPSDLSSIPEMQPTMPVKNRIWPDFPYAKAVIIVCTYVDDNLFFTNSVRKSKIDITCDVPVNWYLSVKYDHNEATGAVTAHQDFYIDKLLQKFGMTECKPVPSPFPSKADKIINDLALPVVNVYPTMHN